MPSLLASVLASLKVNHVKRSPGKVEFESSLAVSRPDGTILAVPLLVKWVEFVRPCFTPSAKFLPYFLMIRDHYATSDHFPDYFVTAIRALSAYTRCLFVNHQLSHEKSCFAASQSDGPSTGGKNRHLAQTIGRS